MRYLALKRFTYIFYVLIGCSVFRIRKHIREFRIKSKVFRLSTSRFSPPQIISYSLQDTYRIKMKLFLGTSLIFVFIAAMVTAKLSSPFVERSTAISCTTNSECVAQLPCAGVTGTRVCDVAFCAAGTCQKPICAAPNHSCPVRTVFLHKWSHVNYIFSPVMFCILF